MAFHQPGKADVHVDVPLTNLSIAYRQNSSAFVADRAFPLVPVEKESNKYFVIPKGAFLRDEMAKRAPGEESAGAVYEVSTDSYSCDVWALHKDIADQIRRNYDNPLNADREATEFLTQKGLLRKERAWAADFFTTGVWTQDFTGVAAGPAGDQFLRWDDNGSSPIEDLRAGASRMHARSGYRPNKLVIGRQVWDKLVDHPDIVGRLDGGQTPGGPAIVTRQALAALLELEEILVMDAVYNAAAQGATDSIGFVAGKAALLLYAPASAGLMTPSAGYTFSWTGLLAGGAMGQNISRMRMEARKSDRVEIEMAWDQKRIAAELGSFFATAVS